MVWADGMKNTDGEIRDGVWADKTKPNAADIADIKLKIGIGGTGVDGAKHVTTSENIAPDIFHEYTTLTIDEGQTLGLTTNGRMIIRCTGKATINGTIDVSGKGSTSNNAENNGGLSSGGGGGGGGGCLDSYPCSTYPGGDGHAGGGSTDDGNGAGGAGGVGSGGSEGGGANGSNGTKYQFPYELKYLQQWSKYLANLPSGGGGGGSSGTHGESGGNGGGIVCIIAPEVEIGASASIIADGDNGSNGTSYIRGGGGGGAGGIIIIVTKKYTDNGGNFSYSGGTGGSGHTDGGYTGGSGGNGADGFMKVILL